jgi:hypothetical protein
MSEPAQRKPFLLKGFEHFALELGEQARDGTPPAELAVPGPEVLGPVADRYGIEVVGPPARAR